MWIAAVAALAAAAISSYNNHQTIKHKNQEAVAGIHAQSEREKQAQSTIGQSLKDLTASTAAKQKLARGQQYQGALKAAGVNGQLAAQGAGGGSAAYKDALASAQQSTTADTNNLTGLYAATDAPLYQRQDEAFRIGDLGTDLGTIGRKSRDDANESQLKIAGINNNPWLDFAAAALQGYAAAQGGGASSMTSASSSKSASSGGANPYNPYGTGNRGSLNGY